MTTALDIRNLTVVLGGRTIIDNVSLYLESKGHVVGLFGQNGAGKTTLIRAICGLINKFEGAVSPRGSSVAYLPDAPFLYGGARLGDLTRLCEELYSDFDIKVSHQILAELKLDLSMKMAVASKGMSEQVHLAIVLGRRSSLYVFDEPLASVDPLTRDKILSMIKRYRNPNSTVVMSTHLISGLEGLFDEAIIVHDGKIVLQSDVRDIVQRGGLEERFKEVVGALEI